MKVNIWLIYACGLQVKVGNCVNFPGGVTCSCNTGYQQQLTEDSHRCLDVDECEGRRGVNYFCQVSVPTCHRGRDRGRECLS
eukprot:1797632-Rhodomonas_salina.2